MSSWWRDVGGDMGGWSKAVLDGRKMVFKSSSCDWLGVYDSLLFCFHASVLCSVFFTFFLICLIVFVRWLVCILD